MNWKFEGESVVGKTVLIGITYFDKNGKVSQRAQYWGTIEAFNMSEGLKVNLRNDGQSHAFVPIHEALRRAEPGSYELNSTMEIVENPDYLYTVACHEAKAS